MDALEQQRVYKTIPGIPGEYDEKTGKHTVKDIDGNILDELYDDDKNHIFESRISYIRDSKKVKSKYDNNTGILESKSFYENDELYKTIDYKYDESGKLVEELWDTNIDGRTDKVGKYQYNKDGNLESKSFYENDELYETIYYKYDESGKLVEESYDMNIDGKPDKLRKYQRDKDGNLEKVIDKDKNNPIQKIVDFFKGFLPKEEPDNNSNETLFPGSLVIKDDYTKHEDTDNNSWCQKFIEEVKQQELGKQN